MASEQNKSDSLSPLEKAFSVSYDQAGTSSYGTDSLNASLVLASDFLVSPRLFQLYEVAREASKTPVPEDWNEKLAEAVQNLPEEASVHDFIKVVAALSPDRARTVIQVLEEEVSVMEDVVDKAALDRIKRLQREHESELKKLKEELSSTRIAAIEANNQLYGRYPDFDWGWYHSDANYLQSLIFNQENADILAEQEKVEATIRENLQEKKFLLEEIDDLRQRRANLQRRLDEGCDLDLEEELEKARRENQLLRDHYNYLCRVTDEDNSRHECP